MISYRTFNKAYDGLADELRLGLEAYEDIFDPNTGRADISIAIKAIERFRTPLRIAKEVRRSPYFYLLTTYDFREATRRFIKIYGNQNFLDELYEHNKNLREEMRGGQEGEANQR